MKLYSNIGSPNARRAASLVGHLGLPVEVIEVNMGKGEHKSPDYLALNPNGKVPTLVDGDFSVWESNAILLYLAHKAGSALLPQDPRGRTDVEKWMFWNTAHMGPAIGKLTWEYFFKSVFGMGAADPAVVAAGQKDVATFAAVLEKHLAGREWLTGALSLADFSVGATWDQAELGKVDLAPYPHISAWLKRVRGLKGWVAAPAPR